MALLYKGGVTVHHTGGSDVMEEALPPPSSEAEAEETWLSDIWTWYFHDPGDSRWTLDSYRRLCDISTIEEFWRLHEAHAPLLTRGMFFLMRECVFPSGTTRAT